MQVTKTISIDQFAFELGAFDRTTLAASLPYHEAYKGATAGQKVDLRDRWMKNYVVGKLSVDMQTSERILSEGKGKKSTNGVEEIKAIDCATNHFRNHVIRPVKIVQEKEEVKLTRAERVAHAAFVLACGGDMKRATVVWTTMAAEAKARAAK